MFFIINAAADFVDAAADQIAKEFARNDARRLAENFGGAGQNPTVFSNHFAHMWELTWRARGYCKDNDTAMKAALSANLAALRPIVDGVEAGPAILTGVFARRDAAAGREALRSYRTVPKAGRYVVFSDVHLTDRGNRQDFFEEYNKALYLDVLSAYYAPNDWALIENGDIEELLIFEPDPATMPDFQNDSWTTILDDREARKWAQFGRIIDDHADYYRTVHDGFIARGAYYRTIGNHDYDLALDSHAAEIATRLGIAWPRASDMVFLVEDGTVQTIICHGHQFDAYCVAAHAPFAGESFSQGGAWAYQGPDRTWTIGRDGPDFIQPWLDGTRMFPNMLVSDEPAEKKVLFGDVGLVTGYLARNLHDTASWERLFDKNVAWDYFTHADPQEAFNAEVETGTRWYKYRHMNELTIVAALEAQFGGAGPQLLLGHSHEPRIRAGKPGPVTRAASQAATYLNSAAAGRFENLIWGIELDDGVATLISWSRDADGSGIVRTVWSDLDAANQRVLRATGRSTYPRTAPHPAAEEPAAADTAAITNMMFA